MAGPLADASGYFAGVVTDKRAIEKADAVKERLWTFATEDFGRVQGQARITLTNVKDSRGEREWAAIFGGGYQDTDDAASIFVVFLDRGVDGWSDGDFVTVHTRGPTEADKVNRPALLNGLGEPALVDTDLNGTADLAYAGDLYGGLYRFDIADGDPSRWRATLLFQAVYGERKVALQPITRRPFATAHTDGDGFLVVFGTGNSGMGQQHTSTDIQSIYAIWDPREPDPVTASPGAKRERLVRRHLVNLVDETSGSFGWRRIVVGEPVRYTRKAPGHAGVYGWYIDFDMPRAERTTQDNPNPDTCGSAPPKPQYPGERVSGPLVAYGKSLLVTTAVPGGLLECSGAPPGSILAIEPATGAAPLRPVFDIDEDGRLDGSDFIDYRGTVTAPGIVFDVDDVSIAGGELQLMSNPDGTADLIVGKGAAAVSLRIGPSGAVPTGRLSWQELPEPAY